MLVMVLLPVALAPTLPMLCSSPASQMPASACLPWDGAGHVQARHVSKTSWCCNGLISSVGCYLRLPLPSQTIQLKHWSACGRQGGGSFFH